MLGGQKEERVEEWEVGRGMEDGRRNWIQRNKKKEWKTEK